jgi:tRNA nucleotidyltransferase/poly(A) polymerase
VATARREKYRQPGALPSVEPGRLKDDLLRRDFSINAIAADVLSGEFHDPANGVRDIEAKRLRVLHEQSFVDDPTRVFRALRLATRLGFALDSQTAELLQDAVTHGALATVAKERLWRELFLAMDESDAPEVLAALMKERALDALFQPRESDLRMMKSVADADSSLDRYVLYTAALLHGNASPVDLEGSGFSQKRARNVMQLANETPRFIDALQGRPATVPRAEIGDARDAGRPRRERARATAARDALPRVPRLQAAAARQ